MGEYLSDSAFDQLIRPAVLDPGLAETRFTPEMCVAAGLARVFGMLGESLQDSDVFTQAEAIALQAVREKLEDPSIPDSQRLKNLDSSDPNIYRITQVVFIALQRSVANGLVSAEDFDRANGEGSAVDMTEYIEIIESGIRTEGLE